MHNLKVWPTYTAINKKKYVHETYFKYVPEKISRKLPMFNIKATTKAKRSEKSLHQGTHFVQPFDQTSPRLTKYSPLLPFPPPPLIFPPSHTNRPFERRAKRQKKANTDTICDSASLYIHALPTREQKKKFRAGARILVTHAESLTDIREQRYLLFCSSRDRRLCGSIRERPLKHARE